MVIIDTLLQKREAEKNPIRVGIIGAGVMSRGLINQITLHTPGMTIAAVYNRTLEHAVSAIKTCGNNNFQVSNSATQMSVAIKENKVAITNHLELLTECLQIDVIVELTGDIKFAYKAISEALHAKKHVVTFNAELEATFGPQLKKMAEENNVLYTLGDGDQPGVTQNLIRRVKFMGFDPLVYINVKGMQDHYRTPATQEGFAKKWGMTPEMVTSFADGTKISFEQAVTANANGMSVAKRGMIGPNYSGHVDEMTSGFYPNIDKLKELGGIVDYVVGAHPSPGVFIFATAKDDLSKKYMKYTKMGEGPLYSFYVPYHLIYFELAASIARLTELKDITVNAEHGMKVEVVTAAKTDLQGGEVLDGLGAYKTYGLCDNTLDARKDNLLPMGLAEGCILKRAIKQDELISLDDVEISDAALLETYLSQTDFQSQLAETIEILA